SDDLAYVGSQDGRLYVVGPRPHSIESAYRLSDNVSVASSPAVGDGQVIFAASDGCLYALESCARVEE
ncbi:MAG TPA: PQQ-binding-like beta-propeller repeat protein, partial [Armatimonadota bacterium]|nr:PQQ-binding-like beta-propeller repeat protein [Armatimonadota bacterium]